MSSFQLSDNHITAMMNGAMTLYRGQFANGHFRWCYGNPSRDGELTLGTAGQVGTMLLDEHETSLRHEYGGGPAERSYHFDEDRRPVDPLKVLKTATCYEYQSCEHPGWEASEAAAFTRSLVNLAINGLPGYGDAPWGVASMADILAPADTDEYPRLRNGLPDTTSLRYARWKVASWVKNLTANEQHYRTASPDQPANLAGTRSQLSIAREAAALLREVAKL